MTTVANSTGEAVVEYFSGQTDEMPSSCNSFQRMDGDNSQLTLQCDQWGDDRSQYVGKWGHYRVQGYRLLFLESIIGISCRIFGCAMITETRYSTYHRETSGKYTCVEA